MFGFGIPELIVLLMFLVVPVLWIAALIDAIKSDFNGNNKVIWIILIILIPLLGSVLYFFIGRGQRLNSNSISKLCACGAAISKTASFCSQCGNNIS